jgi:tRNA (guanine37-N1)-methyltransferase
MSVEAVDLRDFTDDRHRTTDDYPYGGGTGMIMKPEPVVRGIRRLRELAPSQRVILMTPHGRLFNQMIAEDFAQAGNFALVCGRYEGIDARVAEHYRAAGVRVGAARPRVNRVRPAARAARARADLEAALAHSGT